MRHFLDIVFEVGGFAIVSGIVLALAGWAMTAPDTVWMSKTGTGLMLGGLLFVMLGRYSPDE